MAKVLSNQEANALSPLILSLPTHPARQSRVLNFGRCRTDGTSREWLSLKSVGKAARPGFANSAAQARHCAAGQAQDANATTFAMLVHWVGGSVGSRVGCPPTSDRTLIAHHGPVEPSATSDPRGCRCCAASSFAPLALWEYMRLDSSGSETYIHCRTTPCHGQVQTRRACVRAASGAATRCLPLATCLVLESADVLGECPVELVRSELSIYPRPADDIQIASFQTQDLASARSGRMDGAS